MTPHKKKQTGSKAGQLLLGCGVCLLSFIGVMLLAAMLILTAKDPLKTADLFSPLAFAAAGLLGGLIGRRCDLGGRLFLFCPPLVMLTALFLGILLSGGRIPPAALLSQAIYLGASYLGFYLGRAGRKRHRRHR